MRWESIWWVLGFYWGNRFSAKKWAIEHNQDLEMGFIERLKSIEHEVIE